MSLVSHDSIWNTQYGVKTEPKNEAIEKKKAGGKFTEEEKEGREVINDDVNIKLSTKINTNDDEKATTKSNSRNDREFKIKSTNINGTNTEHLNRYTRSSAENETKTIHHNIYSGENIDNLKPIRRKYTENDDRKNFEDSNIDLERNKIHKEDVVLQIVIIKTKDDTYNDKISYTEPHIIHKNDSVNRQSSRDAFKTFKSKIYQRPNGRSFSIKNCASNALYSKKRKVKWTFNTGVLILLIMLNVAGLSSAEDSSTFASSLTSRMIASFLGYPSTCSLGNEVRPCTLTLTCWLRGGTRLRGCGGWLFSCCGAPEPSRENLDNSIPSSEWKYKPPTKLRQVPQRNVLPNNVFRRRVDDDVTQMECGLPSSRILQKRIIGGREARFAEFPWQAHVRISEFQCGGVLVSRRFVATAAHCVSRAHTRDIAVWLGAIDTSATHHPARKLGVIQKILHPLFQFRMTQPDRYDIALLKLSRPITYMSHILPICLPDQDLDLRGRSGVIAGWGKTDASNGHTGTNLLRSATVPILSKEQCINWHQSKQISVEIHSEMICAGHSDGHQDACLGDSGGPLIVFDNGRYYLVGITSAGFGCGVDHQPGIYHNVKLTANWIRSVISPPVTYNDNYLK